MDNKLHMENNFPKCFMIKIIPMEAADYDGETNSSLPQKLQFLFHSNEDFSTMQVRAHANFHFSSQCLHGLSFCGICFLF